MRTRIRIGPFTFGRTGVRLSYWRKGTGFSIPLFNRKAQSFGKIRLAPFSFFFSGKSKKRVPKKTIPRNFKNQTQTSKHGYLPWTNESDEKLELFYCEGKTVKELSEIFGRTNGAIRSRIKKLELKEKYQLDNSSELESQVETKQYNFQEIRKPHKQAYQPWTNDADEKLVLLFREGKTVKELSEIFGRTNGAIRSRINKLLLE